MLEYKPWAKKELKSILSVSDKKLPILDIQVGGACNLNCRYCDTPKYGAPCLVDLKSIEELINTGNIQWVYICGLGEPTANKNLPYLKKILEMCSSNNIGCSMFSNIVNIDAEIAKHICNGTLNLLFKLDTLDVTKMNYLYNTTLGYKIRENISWLRSMVNSDGKTTNLGASIVPTGIAYDGLEEVINYCVENNIFPFIGPLENAGKGSAVYDELKVSDEKLAILKKYVEVITGSEYETPICPATISSIHISNENKVLLDERTGLSCPWFWLDEPKMIQAGDIRNMKYSEIVKAILEYRKSKLSYVRDIEQNISSYPLGGCGGDVKQLLKTYISINERHN